MVRTPTIGICHMLSWRPLLGITLLAMLINSTVTDGFVIQNSMNHCFLLFHIGGEVCNLQKLFVETVLETMKRESAVFIVFSFPF